MILTTNMTINKYLKWVEKIIKTGGWREYKDEHGKPTGKGYQYYPVDLIPHLTHTAKDCENCKNVLAENLAIQVNIKLNGGQYRKSATHY